jgi:hypothetical protein
MQYMNDKKTTSFRLTPQAFALLAAIAGRLGISQTATLEIAIRRLAALEHVTIDHIAKGASHDHDSDR